MDSVIIKLIAMMCHQANKGYCESIGDKSQLSWDLAEDWQKESAIKGVEFAVANTKVTSEDMHESWMQEKINTGWNYGEIKDSVKKTHPCMVPYEQLPEEQKMKDKIFKHTVKMALSEL